MGPSIKRILEQWDAIIQFVAELAKDPRKVPKSINYKRVYMMLGPKEKLVTRVSLEFLNHIIPVFEKFLLLFQKSCPVVHILYDNLCDILIKPLRRFIKPQGLETSMVQISHLLIAQSFNCLTKKLLLEKAQERY